MRTLSVALTLVALALLVGTAAMAASMLISIDFTGLGRLGVVGLAFPLHLLALTVGAATLLVLARRLGARLAAGALGFVLVASVLMAVGPSLAQWQRARQYGVSLSLREYLMSALHVERGGPQLYRTVEYGIAPDGTKLVLDVWPTDRVPAGALRPAFVRVHGGAFIQGQRSELGAWSRWLNTLGYDVFDVDYRLPPPERWQDEVGDVKCALGWVAAHADELHVDPARIGIIGYSAGGNLALLAAYTMGDPALPPSCDVSPVAVRTVVNLYGPGDLSLWYRSSGSRAYVQDALGRYIGGSLEQYPERYRVVSPVTHVGRDAPPTITLLGTSDRIVPVAQGVVLQELLARAGRVHELYLLPATDHGFDINWGGFPTQIARAKVERFLRRYDGR
jgi:acetyl esterase/lipase